MKVKPGTYYRNRDGEVIGPLKSTEYSNNPFSCNGRYYSEEGRWGNRGEHSWDLISEVIISDVPLNPDLDLKAGEWELSTGEVVTLTKSHSMRPGFLSLLPFEFRLKNSHWFVLADGSCFDADSARTARLTRPYVRKAPVERLEALRERIGANVHAELCSIIEDMKAK